MSHLSLDVDPTLPSSSAKGAQDRSNVLLLSSEYLDFDQPSTAGSHATLSSFQRCYIIFIRIHTAASLIAAILLFVAFLNSSDPPTLLQTFTIFVLLSEALVIVFCVALYLILKMLKAVLRISLVNIGYLPLIYSILRYAVHFFIIFCSVKILRDNWESYTSLFASERIIFVYEVSVSVFIVVRNLVLGICSRSMWDSHLLEMERQTFDVDESYIREIKKEVHAEIMKFKKLDKGMEDPKYIEMMKVKRKERTGDLELSVSTQAQELVLREEQDEDLRVLLAKDNDEMLGEQRSREKFNYNGNLQESVCELKY